MRSVLLMTLAAASVWPAGRQGEIPAGFTSILPRNTLDGWYISPTNRHGNTQYWKVADGVLTISQDRKGHGGLLVTRKKYRDYEVYLEVWPDWGCDGGLFLRTNDQGQGYQVMIDYLEKGSVGGVFLANVQEPALKQIGSQGGGGWEHGWNKEGWNSIRARIEGPNAHITVWVNGNKVTDYTFPRNFLPGGAEEASIGLQVHMGGRWTEGKVHRYRNIAVRELK